MKKKCIIILMTVLATLGVSITAWAGTWKSDEKGWWYEQDNGNYMSGFMVEIDGKWYSFGNQGYMITGWLPKDGEWYYMDPDGARASGWREIGGKWYFFEKDGIMLRNAWKNQSGKKYYFNDDGSMAVGLFEPAVKENDRDEYWYYADPAKGGAIRTDGVDEKSGMKFTSSGRVYVRSKEDRSKWVPLATLQDRNDIIKEELETKYLGHIYWNEDRRFELSEAMELEAREKLTGYLSEEELNTFIDDLSSRIRFK